MLAIIIPYFKYDFFEATLQSLALQTNQQFHVYIGDDASPNAPTDLLKKFKDQFSFTYHRFDTNLGGVSLVQQWNRCLEMVQNEDWIMIVGDDDTLESNVVASFYEKLTEINVINSNIIRFASQVIDKNGKRVSTIYHHPKLESGSDFLERKFKGGTRSSLSEYVFKKEQFVTIGFKDFPLAWYSDLLMVFELAIEKSIYTINSAVVNFRLSGLNITSRNEDLLLKNKSTFYFYKYLLENYGNQFSVDLMMLLFDRFEKTILDNKKNMRYWRILFSLYLKFYQWERFWNLGVKIKRSIK